MAFGDVGDPSNGNPAGYIRGLLNEGVGPTEGLRIYRDDGGAIQDSRFPVRQGCLTGSAISASRQMR